MHISIGIPAYNEAANIKKLLLSLLNQQTGSFKLTSITVLSDGSTDATVALTRSISDSRIQVIAGRKRQGQAYRQNQFFTQCHTPIAVLLNADILPVNSHFLRALCQPLTQDSSVGLTSAKIVPSPQPKSLVSRVLSWHLRWKVSLFEAIDYQDNIYLCHGRARAFSKRLYSQLRFPVSQGEDAYSYIFTHAQNLKFVYTPKAQLYCSVPASVTDHLSQSLRFYHSLQHSTQLPPKTSASPASWYHIPIPIFTTHLVRGVIAKPLYSICYAFILCLTFLNLHTHRHPPQLQLWQPASSTKTLG